MFYLIILFVQQNKTTVEPQHKKLKTMKKLSNVSPFILLLAPVFMMFVLAFATSSIHTNQNEEVALKAAPSTTGSIIKATTAILK